MFISFFFSPIFYFILLCFVLFLFLFLFLFYLCLKKSSRLVQCFSSNPEILRLNPDASFTLVAGALNEVAMTFMPSHTGKQELYVHVVGITKKLRDERGKERERARARGREREKERARARERDSERKR
jgi:hypothetical protein